MCLIYESIKTLQSNASVLFKLVFTNNYFLSCLFFFSLIIGLYPAALEQICDPTVELTISIGISGKEVKAEIEIHPQSWTNYLIQSLVSM